MRMFRVALTGDFLNEHGTSPYGDLGLPLLEGVPHVQYHFLTEQAPRANDTGYWDRLYSLEVTPEQIANVEGLIVLRPWVNRQAFAQGAENLVVIGRSGAGYDKVDLEACTENDVAVFNAPLALNHATASTALLFMLALAKRLPEQDRITREGRWDLQAAVMGHEVQGRTLGIVGLGHSGQELVRLVAPFAMRVLAYSPHADPAEAAALSVRLTSLEELLRESDFVSLHCRLTSATRRLIGREQLALMKRTAYLINVARGEVVDQPALVAALRERMIAGAALDVFEIEPLPKDDPLTQLDNVILTPHWSASSAD
ncbi:MAG: dehydrogenase, partial [Planctomycetes bacterium]|nr:dehydrogenase [Planctomycetota bacterium]